MKGQIGFGYVEHFERLDDKLIGRLRGADAASVTDAQNRTGCMDAGIKPLAPGKRVFGPAVTVDLPPGDNLMLYVAMKIAKPGDVLVVNTNGNQDKAVWGELMTHSAMALKLGGLVVDGYVRDGAANRQLPFPIFCRGAVPVSVEKNGPGFVNGEICCGGVVVRPGDIVVGDDDGVVIVRKENVPLVVQHLERIEAREKQRKEEIAGGKALPGWLDKAMNEKGLHAGNGQVRELE